MTSDKHSLFLIRHGRTVLNAEGRLRGLADPVLDPQGINEANATANALRLHGIELVVSSPLQRAATTARIIAEAAGVDCVIDDAFNDRDYGAWTGKLKEKVIEQWGSIDSAPGVEPESVVRNRALKALDALISKSEATSFAIVTHDAVIRPILASIRPDLEARVETGSWSELVLAGSTWSIVSVDNTAS